VDVRHEIRIAAGLAAACAYYTALVAADDPRADPAPEPTDAVDIEPTPPPPIEPGPADAPAGPQVAEGEVPERPARRRIAVNTAIFAVATGLSRLAGLVREIIASSYFATSGAFSAFTIAFQIPNLLRQLVADQAITAAFVPIFTELLEENKKKEAFELATTLFIGIILVLGVITGFFMVTAGVIMPVFTGADFTPMLDHLTSGLSRVLFPIVVLLGLNGLCVGILNAYDHFTIPGIAPLVWNFVILGLLVGLKPAFHGQDQLYAYAIAILVATAVQFAMCFPVLKRMGFRFAPAFHWRDPRIRQILKLMLPVTISLGIINFDLVLNATLGSRVSDQAPRAIDAAFRIYMLPQGMFSVALATVLFPALARYAVREDFEGLRATAANGLRQIFLLLIPAAAITAVLAEPVVRLIYQHGHFGPSSTGQVKLALFWFSFALPLNGGNLLLTRTFFSLRRPWLPTALSAGNIVINTIVSLALYHRYGIAGLVIGTVAGNLGMLVGQGFVLRRELNGLEGRRTLIATGQMLFAAGLLGLVTYGAWYGLDQALGRAIFGQLISVGVSITLGIVVYAVAVTVMRIEEATQIRDLVASRLPGHA
jgi:putative peptidoglycan lipid II flippase